MRPDHPRADAHVLIEGVRVPIYAEILDAAGIASGSEVSPDTAFRLVVLEGVYKLVDASIHEAEAGPATSDLRRVVAVGRNQAEAA